MKTSLLRQQTTSGKDFEPPLLLFRWVWVDIPLISIKFSFQYGVAVYSQVPQLPQASGMGNLTIKAVQFLSF